MATAVWVQVVLGAGCVALAAVCLRTRRANQDLAGKLAQRDAELAELVSVCCVQICIASRRLLHVSWQGCDMKPTAWCGARCALHAWGGAAGRVLGERLGFSVGEGSCHALHASIHLDLGPSSFLFQHP